MCMAETCMVCYIFYFEKLRPNWCGCGSDMFCFSIVVIRLCIANITSADGMRTFAALA